MSYQRLLERAERLPARPMKSEVLRMIRTAEMQARLENKPLRIYSLREDKPCQTLNLRTIAVKGSAFAFLTLLVLTVISASMDLSQVAAMRAKEGVNPQTTQAEPLNYFPPGE